MLQLPMPILREKHPLLYSLNLERHRMTRTARHLMSRTRFSNVRHETRKTDRIFAHKSLLLRKLGDTDMRLQVNKVTNLRIAAEKLNGLLIRPGETFSFWRSIGRPTESEGYLTGMLLADGAVKEGIGGGLCQMANLLYWMALHSPLTVVERHHHSLDVFPDSGRTLPFGSGASVFFNYIDLQFRNDTATTFRLRVWVDTHHLHGELHVDALPALAYHVEERDHRFFKDADNAWWRENRLHRISIDRRTGKVVQDSLIAHNIAKVLYSMDSASEASST